jgi:CubicO group peptidase (beta-lactamase class C family)
MADLEQAVHAVEHGLSVATPTEESPVEKAELRQRMTFYKVPGLSIALIDREELAWAKGYGVVEAGCEEPVTADTIFQAASISKPLTAMIALHLVEDGLLDLDADVNDVLHSWKIPLSKYTQAVRNGTRPKVTLRGLLSHTAGMNIRGYTGYPSGRELPSLQQILNGEPPANSKPVRVMQAPGKAFRYSGGGYMVTQQLVEDVTGKPLAALAKEFIFNKLGMLNSTFDSHLPQVYLPQAATAHRKTGKPVPGKWHTYPEQAPASLWSTPSDLARLVVEVLRSYNNESNLVLSAQMTRQMLIPVMGIGGLGFNIVIKDGITRFGHPGWNEGFHNFMLSCLESGQGVVWMTNGENGKKLGWELMRGLAEVYPWAWW